MSSAHKRIAGVVRQLSPSASVTVTADAKMPAALTVSVSETAGAGGALPPLTWESVSAPLLKDHVAIITGAGQGIGAATALLFAAHGAKVVVSDIDVKKTQNVTDLINKNSAGSALAFAGDVTDKAFPAAIVKATITAFGHLNILVNNAGYTWDVMSHKTSDEQWDAMLLVHNTAPFRLIRAAAPYLRDAAKAEIDAGQTPRNRCIVNVSSTSGIHGNVGQANYATAKAGINGLTKTMAKEWGPFGVRTNSVAFGLIETRLTAAKEQGAAMQVNGKTVALGIPGGLSGRATDAIPLRRAGTPKEAAGAVLALASPLAAYITGHVLECTGGAGI